MGRTPEDRRVIGERRRGPDRRTSGRPAAALGGRSRVPPLPEVMVDRPRLHEALSAGVRGPLTLVSAPAGTGKTVAGAAWFARRPGSAPPAWLCVDDDVPDDGSLWALVAQTLGSDAAGMGPGVLSVDRLLDGTGAPTVLVLDCARPLSSGEAGELARVVDRAGDRLRTVLLVRSDPPLPLHVPGFARLVTQIRSRDLAFTSAEARALLEGHGADLSDLGQQEVLERTRGWVTGLVLTATAMASTASGEDPEPEAAARPLEGVEGPVMDYLREEVLERQTPAARTLLLRTSVVDELPLGLAEALAGPRAARALSALARGNTFLEEVPGPERCYRHHPLVARLLRAELAHDAPEELAGLHRAAADWLISSGGNGEVVQHLVGAGAWGEASRQVVDQLMVTELLVRGDVGLPGLGDTAPGRGVARRATLGALALARGDLTGADPHLAAVRAVAGRVAAPVRLDLTSRVLLAYRATCAGDAGRALAEIAAADRLLAQVPSGLLHARPDIPAVLRLMEGRAAVVNGDLPRAEAAFRAVVAAPDPAGAVGCRLSAAAWGQLALLAARRGHLRDATDLADRAVEAAAAGRWADAPGLGGGPVDWRPAVETARGWVGVETGALEAAERHLAAAGAGGSLPGAPLGVVLHVCAASRIRRMRGDLAGAREVLAAVGSGDLPPWLDREVRLEAGLTDVLDGHPEHAWEWTAAVEPRDPLEVALLRARAGLTLGVDVDLPVRGSQVGAPPGTAVELWILEAWRQERGGDRRRAQEALERALRVAQPEGMRRPFTEAPVEIRRLLSQRPWAPGWLTSPGRGAGWERDATAGTERSRGGALPSPMSAGDPPLERLTAKELEVLGHLAALLTTEEIAATMYVSVNTVRTHVRSILRKLSASRRNEAIRRARVLGMLTGEEDRGSVVIPAG